MECKCTNQLLVVPARCWVDYLHGRERGTFRYSSSNNNKGLEMEAMKMEQLHDEMPWYNASNITLLKITNEVLQTHKQNNITK